MDRRLIELLPDLALFVLIARSPSLSEASRSSGIPTARLSRRLADLERKLDLRLIDRTSRRFQPTREGQSYLAALEPAIGGLSEAFALVIDAQREPSGTLRLTSSPDFGAGFLARLIAEFRVTYPKVNFEVDLTPRQLDVGAERFDAAIRVGPLIDSELTVRRLASIPSGLYASPAYLDRHGRPAHPEELIDHCCLTMPHMRDTVLFRRGAKTVEVTTQGSVKTNNLLMLRRLCGDGVGIAALNPTIAAEGAEHCPVERVLAEWSLEPAIFYFVTPTRLLPTRTRAFYDFARERLRVQGY
ncbi:MULTISPECIES: LysR family transcriptional regulator [Sphingomonas]|uniref:LysR family transcriptional regulator n=1 Tax=Sphingomonas TaxID=13687 RepID=UPI000DEF4C8B|nr:MULTISPECIES: LysR family transcriptional regulator [Sphingomonas]